MILIGLSGEAGSGKDTVTSIFHGLGGGEIQSISLGDLIRDELKRLGGTPDRPLQQTVADYRRSAHGGAYWIERALTQCPADAHTLILNGIYAPDEARYLLRAGGALVWIDAPETSRLSRIVQRQDGSRDAAASRDPARFRAQLERERVPDALDGSAPALLQVKELATSHINNDGDMEALQALVQRLKATIEADAERRRGNLGLITARNSIEYDAARPWSDTLDTLEQLEKAHFFETFLGSPESTIANDQIEISPNIYLSELVRAIYKPNLRSITGNQTAKRLARVFQIEQPAAALSELRRWKPSNQEEEYFTGLSDAEFYDLHLKAWIAWMNSKDAVLAPLAERLDHIHEVDQLQFEGKKDRSISRMHRDGVVLSIAGDAVEYLCHLAVNPILKTLPILEFVKSHRIFGVSGFMGSKASVVIHDIIDHMWTFELLERIGLIAKYQDMFDAIGNPEKIDIFKREGEAVASISYGVRAFEGVAAGFRPLVGSKDIVRMVREMRGRLSGHHTDALHIINNLESDGTEWRSLGYTFSNYLTELDEQRRTYGAIKYRDPATNRVSGELDPCSPDYLCFFIEVHRALLDSTNKHRNALFYAHFILEEYLRSAAHSGPTSNLAALIHDGVEWQPSCRAGATRA